MSVLDTIRNRKSIRQYISDEIPEELLQKILEAGRLAPSSRNGQNWQFYLVRDKEKRVKLKEACGGQDMVSQAPVTLVVCGNNDRIMTCGQSACSVDCSIALSFMMLEATELGLGSCWLGLFDNNMVKEILDIPQEFTVVAVTPLGFADEEPAPRPRKTIEELVHYL